MTQEELKQYKELNEKFESDCDRVCAILSGSKKRCKYDNISYADKFSIEGDTVYWEGTEYFCGDHEWHYGCFPSDFLTMSNDELCKIVERKMRNGKLSKKGKTRKMLPKRRKGVRLSMKNLKRSLEDNCLENLI